MNLEQAIEHVENVVKGEYISYDEKEALEFCAEVLKRFNVCTLCNACVIGHRPPVEFTASENEIIVFMGPLERYREKN
jgi:hypothetical protein